MKEEVNIRSKKTMTLIALLISYFVFVIPDDIDPLCSKFQYLSRYTLDSNLVEKYYISIKGTDIIYNGNKVYFGDGLYRKFKGKTYVSVACDNPTRNNIVFNEYKFDYINRIIDSLNYSFDSIIIIYNPSEGYDNLYYYCIGKKFYDHMKKSGYKVDYIPVDDYNKLVETISRIRSERKLHLVNNSIDYIFYKGKILHNSSISRFIVENSDNIILVSFSYSHCSHGIAHICLDSSYESFKSAVDDVLSGNKPMSYINNDKIYVNSSIFKMISSPNLDYLMNLVTGVY
ncbi:MAG: hypothetical protein QXD03_02365 [Candidatus Anstonellales archaeon]